MDKNAKNKRSTTLDSTSETCSIAALALTESIGEEYIGSASSASGIRPLELLPPLCDHWACYRVLQCRWQHSDAEVLVTALLPVREVDAPGGGDLVELPLDNGAAIKTFLPGSCSGVLV